MQEVEVEVEVEAVPPPIDDVTPPITDVTLAVEAETAAAMEVSQVFIVYANDIVHYNYCENTIKTLYII